VGAGVASGVGAGLGAGGMVDADGITDFGESFKVAGFCATGAVCAGAVAKGSGRAANAKVEVKLAIVIANLKRCVITVPLQKQRLRSLFCLRCC
jgi:hypothetical protein